LQVKSTASQDAVDVTWCSVWLLLVGSGVAGGVPVGDGVVAGV